MIRGRPFSLKRVTDDGGHAKGSAVLWLIGAVCFVIVFLGVAFLLIQENAPKYKPPVISTGSKQEIRETIQPYVPFENSHLKVAEGDEKPEVFHSFR